MSESSSLPPELDLTKPHSARIYDYYLSGKNHFAPDRETGDKVLENWPAVRTGARENRAFLGRAIRFLAAEAGVRQFLDIGAGLPTTDNVHEVAQRIAPESRVVYADNDPLVLAHARALLTSAPEGRTAYLHADLRDPAAILEAPATREVLDFARPIALSLVTVLHYIPDEDGPERILATLLDALPSGSYLVASHMTLEHDTGGGATGLGAAQASGIRSQPRESGEFARLAFGGLELVPPGVVLASEWRPEDTSELRPPAAEVNIYAGVARKP